MDLGFLGGVFGLILSIVILFISILWIIFPLMVLNRLRKITIYIEAGNTNTLSLTRQLTKGNELLEKIAAASLLPPTVHSMMQEDTRKLNISTKGKDIGSLDLTSVRIMLDEGVLSGEDYYFDAKNEEWRTLESHLELR